MSIDIRHYIDQTRKKMTEEKLDAFYFSSFDVYLNEYTEKYDCHRYFVSNFSGSTGEALVLKDRVCLYVDGRYHEQANSECDPHLVDIIKCSLGRPITQTLTKDIGKLKIKSLGLEPERVPLDFFQSLEKRCLLKPFEGNFFKSMAKKIPTSGKVAFLNRNISGEHYKDKIKRILRENQSIFLSKLDSLCWLLNLRGFQLPYHSVIKAKALISRRECLLFIPKDSTIEDNVTQSFSFVRCNEDEYPLKLQKKLALWDSKEMLFNPREISALDARLLGQSFQGQLVESGGVTPFQSLKNPIEITSFEDSFNKSDQAIFQTLSWLKKESSKGTAISEQYFRDKTEENYRLYGAKCQSFPTIAGFGSNASIIHYTHPQDNCYLQKGDMALLDSGGIFSEGLATDCTRTVLGHGLATDEQKKIYTLVLIGLLRLQNISFKSGTLGKELDALARGKMKEYGFNYAHGTGHGVGINVHEGGYSLSPSSSVPLEKGKVGSLEPGIYLPQFGGVRLENVAVVEEDPNKKGHLRFRSFVLIGFDHELINFDLMANEEKEWLCDYEKKCAQKGRSFYYI